jgi:hypothetical protein
MHILENPVFGEDYKEGYVFFSYTTSSVVSAGIALFQSCETKSGPISHCGIISGPGKCLEATTPVVCESDFIAKYINEPHTIVFLRKPVGWTPEKAQVIIQEGRKHLGKKYSYTGLLGSALKVILSWSYKLFPSWRYKADPFNSKKEIFCSEYIAMCMVPAMGKVGCLQYDPTNIYPSTLFEDRVIWTPWDYQIVDRKLAEGKCVIEV